MWVLVMSSVHLYMTYDKHYMMCVPGRGQSGGYHYPYPKLGAQYASTHIHCWDMLQLYMFPQAGQSASGDLLAVKDAHIAALQTELRGKDRILQANTKVGTD